MKPIKFDLTINNGNSLRTLHDLEKNLSPALLEHFYSGKLARWLEVRKLDELADKVEHLLTLEKSHQVQLFQNLCEVFIGKISEEDARQAMQNYKPAIAAQISHHDEIEQLKFENQTLKVEIEKLKNQLVDRDAEETPNFELPNESVSKDDRELLKLLETGNEQQRAEIASSPNLSIFLQHKLLNDSAESVVIALAKNEFLADEIQEKLAIEGMPKIREALATNEQLNEKQQNYLFETGSREVKAALATNPFLISSIKLVLVEDWDFIQELASNISLSLDLQEKILNSYHDGAKKNLACNPSTDVTLFSKLMLDESDDVKKALASNISLPEEIQKEIETMYSKNKIVMEGLASNPYLSELLVEKIERNSSYTSNVREKLANNPVLSEVMQARLISLYCSDNVARSLAANPSLKPAQQAELLIKKGTLDVKLNLWRNHSVSNALKEKLSSSFNQEDLRNMADRLEHTKNLARRLSKEEQKARENYCSYDVMGIFGSISKSDRLRDEFLCAERKLNNVQSEIEYLKLNIETLEQILEANQ